MKLPQQSGARRAKRGVSITTLQRAMMLAIVVMTAGFLAFVRFVGQRYSAPVEIKYDRLFRGFNRPKPTEPSSPLRSFFKQRASALNKDQQMAVDMTKHAWKAYRDHADWKDFLNVKTMKGGTVYAHDMALTLVDSLDTLFVLGLHNEFDEASAWVKVNLESVMLQRGYVSFFEITIRSLGGLLSAYYLSANTFQLEFAYLAHATKNTTYMQYVDRINKMMQEMVAEHHPDGQIPVRIDWESKRGSRSQISWGALGDSYYEYLLKQWLLSNKQDDKLRNQYVIAVNGMKAKLLGTSYPSKFVFLTEINRNGDQSQHMEHLTCFVPGLLALGYMHGMPKEHLDLAKELARTCVEMYLVAGSKVAPEITHFTTEESYVERPSLGELFVYEQQDFNILRPETIESLMVLHRATGDPIYREYGRTIMNALETHCRVAAGGYRSVSGVFYGPVRSHRPDMESFFIAETLKYLYLLFSDDDVLPLDAIVLNTEAHPFPILRP
uniref:alpha-1,2-Mannosidase n=1 Tax=Globisporangium ultimum (strain ATCC 200006 / CBS 805.95 / DAOM BR144) TaxID=431595 RepID=K3X0V5_GLOUD